MKDDLIIVCIMIVAVMFLVVMIPLLLKIGMMLL